MEKVRGKKLRQILKSSGANEAREWAEKMDAISCLRDISQESGKIGKLAKQALK